MAARSTARSEQREEILDGELRLLEDVRQRRALDRSMRGDDDFERLQRGVLLQADVTPALSHDDPASALQGAEDALVAEARDFGQTAISTNSAVSRPAVSSSTGSR
jgi:hypothetical protein